MTATKQERRQQAAPAQSVDVVEDFDYSNHSDSYNQAFKAVSYTHLTLPTIA